MSFSYIAESLKPNMLFSVFLLFACQPLLNCHGYMWDSPKPSHLTTACFNRALSAKENNYFGQHNLLIIDCVNDATSEPTFITVRIHLT